MYHIQKFSGKPILFLILLYLTGTGFAQRSAGLE